MVCAASRGASLWEIWEAREMSLRTIGNQIVDEQAAAGSRSKSTRAVGAV
jgi:hypothetical protein